MSAKYSAAEARVKLPQILDEVEYGQRVELTRRGKPVAMVVSSEEYRRLSQGRASFVERYAQHKAAHRGLDREDLEGLREDSEGRSVRL